MAITYQSITATVYNTVGNTTTVSPTYPTGIVDGDLLVMTVGQKPSVANSGTIAPPDASWVLIDQLFAAGGYGTTTGADVGNTNLAIYYRLADGTEVAGTAVPVTMTNNNIAWANIARYSNATGTWVTAGVDGQQTTTPTSPLSVTTTAALGLASGDHIYAAMCVPTDVGGGATFSAEAFTSTGITFATASELLEPSSGTNNDIGGVVVRSNVTAGTGTNTVTFTSTLSGTLTNIRGPVVIARLREGAPPAQTLTATAVNDATDLFGAATVEYTLRATAVNNSVDLFGAPSLVKKLAATSVDNSTDLFGAARVNLRITASAVNDRPDLFGSPLVGFEQTITASSYVDGDLFGSLTVVPGTVIVTASVVDDSVDHFGLHQISSRYRVLLLFVPAST